MKKTISIIASIAICAGMVTAVNANSLSIVVDTTKYEQWRELEEYTGYSNGNIYRKASETETGYYLINSEVYNGYFYGYASFSIDYNHFSLTQEECLILSEYLSQNYPEITISNESGTYVEGVRTRHILKYNGNEYNDELTSEEQFEIALNIKENTGYICNYCWLSSDITAAVVGDLNADNTITASDAAMALSYYASGQTALTVASDEETVNYSLIADYNNDGMVTAVDAALILSDYAKGQVS